MKSLHLFAALLLAPLGAQSAEPVESLPPFIYVIERITEPKNLELLGLAEWPAGDANRNASLLQPLACAGGECRRMIEAPQTTDPDWLSKLLAVEPTHAARVAFLRLSGEPNIVSVVGRLYDSRLNESDKVVQKQMFVIYNGTWRGDGSKARMERELGLAFERVAEFWNQSLAPKSGDVITGKLYSPETLPRVRDVVAKDAVPCKSQYVDYPVVKDLGDYLWLAFPPEKMKPSNSLIIQTRCEPAG